MSWYYTPYAILALLAALFSLVLAVWVGIRRVTGSRYLAGLMLAVAWWSLMLTLDVGLRDLQTKRLVIKLEYIATVTVPLLWLAFAMSYTGTIRRVRRGFWAALAVMPCLTLLVIWTNPAHGLFWRESWLSFYGNIAAVDYVAGPWFWVDSLYVYAAMAVGTVLLLQKLWRMPRPFSSQAVALSIGLAVPWLMSVLYFVRLIPPYVPVAPFAFIVSGAALALAVRRFRLLDIVPIACDVIVETIDDAVVVLDMQMRLVALNPAARRVLEPLASDVIGAPAAEISPVLAQLMPYLEPGRSVDAEIPLGCEAEPRWYALRVSTLFDHRHHRRGYLLALRDVTPFHVMVERAEAADRAKSQFVSNVSHELRTPLTNLKLYLGLLERGKEDRRAFYMDTLRRETERLQNLIENLLNVSRMDLGQIEADVQPVDLNDLARTLAQDRHELFADRGLILHTELAPALPLAQADPRLLEQVITNLLSNALNYTPRGGEVWLRTGCRRRDARPWIVLDVQDTGPGIAQQEQARLFTRFYRGAASRVQGQVVPGTGLGLAISKEIMDLHDGALSVESAEGEGATFTLWLPLPNDAHIA